MRKIAALWFLLTVVGALWAQIPPAGNNDGPALEGIGLIRNDPGAFQGYTLISPLQSTTTFLVDMNGRTVHSWETDSTPPAWRIYSRTAICCGPARRRIRHMVAESLAGAAGFRNLIGMANWSGISPIRPLTGFHITISRGCRMATS